jgi:hypothetical protein
MMWTAEITLWVTAVYATYFRGIVEAVRSLPQGVAVAAVGVLLCCAGLLTSGR